MITCIRHTFAYEFPQDVRPSFPLRPVIELLTSITFPWRPKARQATRPVLLLDDPWVVKVYVVISASISLYLTDLTTTGFSHSTYHSSFYNLTRQVFSILPSGAWRVATRTTIEYRFRRRQLSTRRVWDRFFRLADARRSGEAERILISTLAV